MAVKEFNCNKLKRTFWPFTLKDKVDENGNVVEKGKKIVEKRSLQTKLLLGAGAIVMAGLFVWALVYICKELYNYFA